MAPDSIKNLFARQNRGQKLAIEHVARETLVSIERISKRTHPNDQVNFLIKARSRTEKVIEELSLQRPLEKDMIETLEKIQDGIDQFGIKQSETVFFKGFI